MMKLLEVDSKVIPMFNFTLLGAKHAEQSAIASNMLIILCAIFQIFKQDLANTERCSISSLLLHNAR